MAPKLVIPEEFKDDPGMYEMSIYGPHGRPKGKGEGPDVVEGKFDREVTEGGAQDFDIKAATEATPPKK